MHEYNFRVDRPDCFLLLDNRRDSVFRYPVFPERRETTAKVSDIAPGFATSANINRAGNRFSKYLSGNIDPASNPLQRLLIAGRERGIDSKREGGSRFDPCGAPAAVQIADAICRTQGSHRTSLSVRHKKTPLVRGFFMSGGERGIRTLDTLLTYTPLAGERFRPLSHLSGKRINYNAIA